MDGWEPMARGMALFVCLAFLAYVVWMARAKERASPGGPLSRLKARLLSGPGILRCRQSVRLTPQHTLHVVECGHRQFILACHPAGATLLCGEVDSLALREEVHVQSGSPA